jgi:retron-type reverse transcriptase
MITCTRLDATFLTDYTCYIRQREIITEAAARVKKTNATRKYKDWGFTLDVEVPSMRYISCLGCEVGERIYLDRIKEKLCYKHKTERKKS